MIRKMDIQEIFANHKKEKKLEDQFNNDDILDGNFEEFYKKILIDYYKNLKKEY